VPNLQAEARHVAEDVMNGLNGSMTPSTSTASGIGTPTSSTASIDEQSSSSPIFSRRPVPFRTTSSKRTSETSQAVDHAQGRRNGPEPAGLDGVNTDAVEQVRVNEEVSPRSLPVRPVSGIDGQMGDLDTQGETHDPENIPLGGHHHRSSTVVRVLGTKDRVSMPVLATNKSKAKDPEDDRTPTSRGSFWGKE
jgi:hypothetical protein